MKLPSPALRWPLAIGALLLLPVVANAVLIVMVCRDDTFAVEHDYYQRALRFDEEIAQRARNQELGWSLEIEARRAVGARGLTLSHRLSDRAGAPIAGATLSYTAFPQAAPHSIVRGTLETSATGEAELAVSAGRAGLWRVRSEVTSGADRFTCERTLEAP